MCCVFIRYAYAIVSYFYSYVITAFWYEAMTLISPPSGVYFIEFERTFISTCSILSLSPVIIGIYFDAENAAYVYEILHPPA